MKIKIWTKATGEILAELLETKNRKTFRAIQTALPIRSQVATWGQEIYFPINVKGSNETTQKIVDKGDIGYWPAGDSLCIFFGPTPISVGSEIRPASPVNVVGKVLGDPEVFKKVKDRDEILIESAE
jgi:hypothetical protein